jgi:hypothetical protein
MLQDLSIYPKKISGTWQTDGVFLGNCLQHYTTTSYLEKLPFFSAPFNLAITADAIIDNGKSSMLYWG